MKLRIYDENGTVEGYLNTDSAERLASDGVLNQYGITRNTEVYMTARSKRFFQVHNSMWQGEGTGTEEISKAEAVKFLRQHSPIDEVDELLESLDVDKLKEID